MAEFFTVSLAGPETHSTSEFTLLITNTQSRRLQALAGWRATIPTNSLPNQRAAKYLRPPTTWLAES